MDVRLNLFETPATTKNRQAPHCGPRGPRRDNLPKATHSLVKLRATVFTGAERAAPELAEQCTRLADAAGGVTDEAWAAAVMLYDDVQSGALVALIALINTYNRLHVIVRMPAGSYQPGQFGSPNQPTRVRSDQIRWPAARPRTARGSGRCRSRGSR